MPFFKSRSRQAYVLVAAALLAMALAWTSGYWLLAQARQAVTIEVALDILRMQARDDAMTQVQLALARDRALFIAQTPPIASLVRAQAHQGIDPQNGTPLAVWQAQLAEITRAYVAATPNVFQVHLVGAADGGRELLRVERDDAGQVSVMPADQLQRAWDRPYVQKALRLGAGQVYVSPIEIRQGSGSGSAEQPHPVMLCAATPVFDQLGGGGRCGPGLHQGQGAARCAGHS